MPSKSKNPTKRIHTAAREKLSIDELRPGQLEAIQSVLDGRDTLVVRPTGSGKSAIYQIAGLLMNGVTVVVSPLLALQKDQVESINEQEHGSAALAVNSMLRMAERRQALQKLADGGIEFLFLAPEQLRREDTRAQLRRAKPSLFVVDEAHCVSEWGHNFRPDYLALGDVIEDLGHPTVLALTATASEHVRCEIQERLCMRNPLVLVHGFDRPNISLRVDRYETEREKLESLLHRARWAEKPGIVYTSTRKKAEKLAAALIENGVDAVMYHAGMKKDQRDEVQQQFMEGVASVIVATSAFGMGVDKANVRFVYHYDVSDSLDAYYQEIGRAGRDGEPAEAVLFYRHADTGIHKFHAGSGSGEVQEAADIAAVVQRLGSATVEAIAEEAEVSARRLSQTLRKLEEVGAVQVNPEGTVSMAPYVDPRDVVQATAASRAWLGMHARWRLEQMIAYAESYGCRREKLLRYFGEEFNGPCGSCDRCRNGNSLSPAGVRREVV